MNRNILTTTALAAAILSTSVGRVQADIGDALVAGFAETSELEAHVSAARDAKE